MEWHDRTDEPFFETGAGYDPVRGEYLIYDADIERVVFKSKDEQKALDYDLHYDPRSDKGAISIEMVDLSEEGTPVRASKRHMELDPSMASDERDWKRIFLHELGHIKGEHYIKGPAAIRHGFTEKETHEFLDFEATDYMLKEMRKRGTLDKEYVEYLIDIMDYDTVQRRLAMSGINIKEILEEEG